MLRINFRLFALCLVAIFLFILLKNSQIFDVGLVFRKLFVPQQAANHLLLPADKLSEDYQKLLAENAQLMTLKTENEQLRNLLNFKTDKKYNLETAYLISRDPVNSNLLTISAGSNQGLVYGQAVVVNNGIMVGKVLSVNSDSAVVRLVIDSASKVAVRTGEEKIVSGVLSGSLGLGMNLSYIPQSQDLKKNDLVYTTDSNPGIPGGLVVGRIGEVRASAEDLFKQATVEPIIDLDTLSVLSVIK